MTNRSSSPTTEEVAPNVHPSCCGCSCLHPKAPRALYRDIRGEGEFFTGILAFDAGFETIWKLNDPNHPLQPNVTPEDLAGKGHEMDATEFVLEMGQYETDPQKRQVKSVKDLTNLLFDFKEKPSEEEFSISQSDKAHFNALYPHGKTSMVGCWTIPQVRKDDKVKICAVKHIQLFDMQGAHERLWVCVQAVTTTGIVVGTMCNDVKHPMLLAKKLPDDMTVDEEYNLQEGDLVSFPVTCMYGVEYGENWD